MARAMAEEELENNVPPVIRILSVLFERTANRNDELAVSQQQQCHRRQPAADDDLSAISIGRYVNRIFYNTGCSRCCYVIAFIYVDRFLHLNPSVMLDSFNVHHFFLTAILTSVKFMDGSYCGNDYCGNAHFANVGGISVSEMNKLEVDFLFGLHFNLNVDPITYGGYCSFLFSQMNILNTEVEEEEEEEEEEY